VIDRVIQALMPGKTHGGYARQAVVHDKDLSYLRKARVWQEGSSALHMRLGWNDLGVNMRHGIALLLCDICGSASIR
jgi:hypothetical protein